MSAFDFPASPAIGTKYPNPGIPGIPVYIWDGEKWTTYGGPGLTGGVASLLLPKMNATPGAVGTSMAYTREDHVHPSDTSRVAKSGDTMVGVLTLASDPVADLQAATKKYVDNSIVASGGPGPSNSPPGMDGAGTAGVSALYSRGDHIHPSDATKQAADPDLAAVAGLNNTGIARRTSSSSTWSAGDPVLNSELAPMPAFTFKGNNSGAVGVPMDVDIAALTTKLSPGGGDFLIVSDQSASGTWKKVAVSSMPGASGGITEAPNDGLQYARQSLGWSQISGGGGAPPSNALPIVDGTAAAGTATLYARGDHVHPTDTSRAPLNAPVFTGDARAVTPSPGDSDTSIATTAFVAAAIAAAPPPVSPSNTNPLNDGVAAPGVSALYARGDHIHPTDTTRAPLSAIPPAAGNAPLMDGVAAVGSVNKYAREDHVHPSDTSLVAKAGDTMTGHLTLPTGPAAANAVRKDYVDAAVAAVPVPPAATAAEYISNSQPTKMLTPGAVWAAAQWQQCADVGGVFTPNMGAASDFYLYLTAAGMTLANPINMKSGQKGLLTLIQNTSGTITTWGSNWKFPGGVKPVLSVGNGSYDIISYFWSGNAMYCTFSAGFA
jgi:hypothetical protein